MGIVKNRKKGMTYFETSFVKSGLKKGGVGSEVCPVRPK